MVRRTTTSLSRLMKSGESIILVEVVVQTGFCFVHPNTLQYNSALQHVYLTYFSAEQVISQDGKCVDSIFSIQFIVSLTVSDSCTSVLVQLNNQLMKAG